MTKEELREKLGNIILKAVYENIEIVREIDHLLFEGPKDVIKVTINVEGIEVETLSKSDQETFFVNRTEEEKLSFLGSDLLIDGKTWNERHGIVSREKNCQHIIVAPSSESPPK